MARLFRRLREMAHGGDRLWVELTVTKQDIKRYGLNTVTPGPKLFTGLWYGKDPLSFRSYGKMVEMGGAFPMGTIDADPHPFTLNRLK